jgi:hypothetical protein
VGMIMLNYLLLVRGKSWIRHRLVSNLIAIYPINGGSPAR